MAWAASIWLAFGPAYQGVSGTIEGTTRVRATFVETNGLHVATGEWMLSHDDLGLGQIYRESLFRNPVDLFSAILAEGEPHEYQGIITLDGVSVHHFVSATRRQAYTRAAGPLHIEIWVGVEDLILS